MTHKTLREILAYSEATFRDIVGFPPAGKVINLDMTVACCDIPYGQSYDSAVRYGSALTEIHYRANGHQTFKSFLWVGDKSHHNDHAKCERYMRDIAAGIA
jgi:hypothetical protein